jgi:hypothetical protein
MTMETDDTQQPQVDNYAENTRQLQGTCYYISLT